MARDIIITPKNQEPQIQFTGSGDVSSINLNVGSGISPVSGIREAGSGITTLSFEGTQGQLFSITDNLSSGTIFSVADITGLPLLEVDASGAVKISEYGTSTTVGLTTPKYNFDVFGTGGFQSVVSDKFELYASGDAVSDGQEKLMIYDNNGTFEVRASGQGGGSINNFKIVSDKAAISSEENYIAIDGQKSGDNLICRLRLNGSNRFKFYNEGFTPEASNKNLGANSSSARWKGMYGKFLDLESFNATTSIISATAAAAQSANIAEFKASDDVVVAKVEPDGSIASSGTIKSSGNIICLEKIGINTDSPNDLLEIYNGSMRLRSNYSIKWQGDNNRIRGTSGGSGAGNVTIFAGSNCIGYFGGASAGGTGGLKIGGAAYSETDYKFEVMGSGAVHNLLASGDITVDGSVGIGMFTAGDKLTVGGTLSTKHTGYTTNALRVTHNSNDVYLSLYKRADQSTQAIKLGTAGDSYFNGGDLGIRTTSPDATLHAVAANPTDIGIISQGASSQSANLQEWRASDDVVIAQVEPDGSIATSGDVKVSGDILFQDGSYFTTTSSSTASELRYYGNYFWIRGGSHGISLNVVSSAAGGANISVAHSFSWNNGAITSPTTSADTHLIRVDANKVGIKSTYKNSAGDYGELIASGVSLSGVYLANHVPQDTTNMLYNNAGTLTFNGSAVGGGGGSVTGTPSGVAFFGDDESLTDSSQMFYNSGTNVLTLKSDNPQIEFRGADDNLALKIGDSQSNTNEGAYIGFYWQGTNNSYFDTTSGKTRFRVANGDLWFRNNSNVDIAKMEGSTTDPLWSLYPQGTAQVGQIIKGQALHSANLQEWRASDDVVIAQVEPDGSISSSGDISVGGSFKLYNLGTKNDTHTEYLDIYTTNDTFYIQPKTTGGGDQRDFYILGNIGTSKGYLKFDGDSGVGQLQLKYGIYTNISVESNITKFGRSIRPMSNNSYTNGDTSFRWSTGYYTNLDATLLKSNSWEGTGGNMFMQNPANYPIYVKHNDNNSYIISSSELSPMSNNSKDLGSTTNRWANVNSVDGNFSGSVSGARGFFESTTTTDSALTITSAASQTANLQEWRASDDSILAKVASDGDISTSGDVSALKYRNDGTNNLVLDSTSNMYVAFDGAVNYGFFNTTFQPQIDNGRQLGTSSKRWSQGHIVNLNSVHGDFTGNVDVDGTVTGGLFKLYGLGDSAATDSEFLQVAHVANTYYISTKKTGSATGRDLIFQRDSQNSLKLASAEITSYKSMIPSTDGTLNLGSSSYKWGDIHCGGELKTANIGYTDGDNAMTIADGGKVTFAAGFAVGSDAEGDMLYHNGTSYVRLAKGTDDYILKMNGNVPNWEAESGGGGSSTLASLTDTNISSPANGHILIYDNATSKWDNALMTSSGGTVSFTFGAGTINLEAGVGPSDERLKENVKSIEDSLDKILAMNPVEFEWREGYEDVHKNSGKDIGFIAQEIEKIQPELVGEYKDFKTLDYEKFAPLVVGAIQDLTKELREIKKHLNM